jgi:hypothetical protein
MNKSKSLAERYNRIAAEYERQWPTIAEIDGATISNLDRYYDSDGEHFYDPDPIRIKVTVNREIQGISLTLDGKDWSRISLNEETALMLGNALLEAASKVRPLETPNT